MHGWLTSFLRDRPVFHLGTLEALLASRQNQNQGDLPTLRGLINHLRKTGAIEGIRQRVFRSLLVGLQPEQLDPYLLASVLAPDVVLSHQTALRWHLQQKAPKVLHYFSRQIAHPWTFAGHTYMPVKASGLKSGICRVDAEIHGVIHALRVTGPERTLADVLDRPDLDKDRLQTWRDLRSLAFSAIELSFDGDSPGGEIELTEYLKCLNNRTLNAKVAYFLDTLPLGHPLRSGCLLDFGGDGLPLPSRPVPWDQYSDAPPWPGDRDFELRHEWSLQVPRALTRLEVPQKDSTLWFGSRTLYDSGEVPREFLLDDLRETFGLADYREGQEVLIRKVLRGEDALGILPTGRGKSLTYLQPSTLLNGPTLVISPLVALIEDQVKKATLAPLNAFALTADLRAKNLPLVRQHLHRGNLHLIFIAPESLDWLFKTLPRLRSLVRQIVVDEAHVVVEWGEDFRSTYRTLGRIRDACTAPILALTATATLETQRCICRDLRLKDVHVEPHSVRRNNLLLRVQTIALGDRPFPRQFWKMSSSVRNDILQAAFEARIPALLDFLNSRPGEKGLIYCQRREDADLLKERLEHLGFTRVDRYHAGLSQQVRTQRLKEFGSARGNLRILVATIAFGLGIDIQGLRFVVHYGLPSSLDAYAQGVGRAGRDGSRAEALLLYADGEEANLLWLAGLASPDARNRHRRNTRSLMSWLMAEGCRQANLDRHFGILDGPDCGSGCDSCNEETADHFQPNVQECLPGRPPRAPVPEETDFSWDVDLNTP